jgi:hypothetical protein
VAQSKHTHEPLGSYGEDFYFNSMIYFKKEISYERMYMSNDLEYFVADALKYERYITETLNEVEVEIDVY